MAINLPELSKMLGMQASEIRLDHVVRLAVALDQVVDVQITPTKVCLSSVRAVVIRVPVKRIDA